MCVTVTALGIFPVKKKFKFYYYRTCVCIHITFRSQFLPCVKVLFFMPVSPVLLRQFSSLLLVVGVLSYRCTHCTCFLSCHPHPHAHTRFLCVDQAVLELWERPASAFQALGLKVCTTIPGPPGFLVFKQLKIGHLCSKCFYLLSYLIRMFLLVWDCVYKSWLLRWM